MSFSINFALAVGLAVMLALRIDSKSIHQVLARCREFILPGIDWNMGIAVAGIMVFRFRSKPVRWIIWLFISRRRAHRCFFGHYFPSFTGMVSGSSLATVGILFPLFSPLLSGAWKGK